MPDKPAEKTPPVDEPKADERKSAKKPIVAPDGHETLSQEDIDNRA